MYQTRRHCYVNRHIATAVLVATGSALPALACTMQPPTPPPVIWVEPHGFNTSTGKSEFWVGIEVDLFASPTATNCACGISFLNLPGGLAIIDAMVGITNINTHDTVFLSEFDNLAPNSTTSSSLTAALGSTGGTWFGFSGLIPGFPQPVLAPDEVIKLWFEVEVDPIVLPFSTQVVFAGGGGNPDGSVITQGEHPVELIQSVDTTLRLIPAPTSLASAALLGAALVLRRRR